MGGDGGQVIDRATMVKCKGWGLTKESGGRYSASLGEMNSYIQMVSEDVGVGPMERHRIRMSQCYLSQESLREPVVACRLGNLYNKEAVINALLNKSMPSALAHIKALKDVKHCQLTWEEAGESVLTSMTTVKERGQKKIVCPMTKADLNTGGARAVCIWTTGAVVSAKCLKELKMTECPVTGKAFDPEQDVIPLAPDADELTKLRERLPVRKRKVASAELEASRSAPGSSADGTNQGSDVSSAKASAKEAPRTNEKTETTASKEEKAKKSQKIGDAKSEVFTALFTKNRGPGSYGAVGRDGFGTPAYNRGTLIQ